MHHIIGVRNGTLTLTLGHRLTIIDATAAGAPNSSTTMRSSVIGTLTYWVSARIGLALPT